MELIQEHVIQILILLFLVVTFLLSGFEKVGDWKETVNFTTNHFINSPLKKFTSLLLVILVVMELLGGGMMLVGIFHIATTGKTELAFHGIQICALCIIFMLIGQRLAKDYEGAMSLGVYFLITICGMYLLQ